MTKRMQFVIGTMAIVLVFIFAVRYYRMVCVVRWNTWMDKIYVVSQPGTDVMFVEGKLGKPDEINKPREALMGSCMPQMTSVPKSDKVYVYHWLLEGQGWEVFIFINSSGCVAGSHIGLS